MSEHISDPVNDKNSLNTDSIASHDADKAATEQAHTHTQAHAQTSEQTQPISPALTVEDAKSIRLVVTDMDGTLLDGEGRVPAGLWGLLPRLAEAGIVFAPASGRQYGSLRRVFEPAGEAYRDAMTYIAENGSFVVSDGAAVATTALLPTAGLDPRVDVVKLIRRLAAAGTRVGIVVCTPTMAFVENPDPEFVAQCEPYYADLSVVEDVLAASEGMDVIKLAIFDFDDAEAEVYPLLAEYQAEYNVAVSGRNWIDIMDRGINKGVAIAELQEALGVSAAETMAFGDFLNDLQMMGAARFSVAMANAHPEVAAAAAYRAPDHREAGVVQVLEQVLGLRAE